MCKDEIDKMIKKKDPLRKRLYEEMRRKISQAE
jgi:hypothetical protein